MPNQGFDRAPLTALRVVTATKVGLLAIPTPTGAFVLAEAKAVDPSGDVEQPLTPAANPASPTKSAHKRANAVNGKAVHAIKRSEFEMVTNLGLALAP